MKKRQERNSPGRSDKLYLSVSSLRGKQSVRATFRLPEKTISLLGHVASHLGIKQKSLFDQLLEDDESLASMLDRYGPAVSLPEKRRPKTFVLSRRTLEVLDAMAKNHAVPRDLLVELSIQRLRPILEDEVMKHGRRKRLFASVEELQKRFDEHRELVRKELGESDEMTLIVERMLERFNQGFEELKQLIDRGEAARTVATVQGTRDTRAAAKTSTSAEPV